MQDGWQGLRLRQLRTPITVKTSTRVFAETEDFIMTNEQLPRSGGADDDANWTGVEIELRAQKVSGPGGKIVDSIRVYQAA